MTPPKTSLVRRMAAPFAAAWIAALAFTTAPRWRAVLAMPIFILAMLHPWLRGGLRIARDGRTATGTVAVLQYRPVLDRMVMFSVVLAPVAILTVAISATGIYWYDSMLIAAIPLLVALVGYLIAKPEKPRPQPPIDDETPRSGSRYVVSTLAQRPGTKLSALLLVRDAIDELPAGSVVVGIAASDELLAKYEKLGFTHTTDNRVYKVL